MPENVAYDFMSALFLSTSCIKETALDCTENVIILQNLEYDFYVDAFLWGSNQLGQQ